MAIPKSVIGARLPIRRGLGESEAALYVGLGATKFGELVKAGVMPKPRRIGSSRLWDIDDLDAAFKALPLEGDKGNVEAPNPWH